MPIDGARRADGALERQAGGEAERGRTRPALRLNEQQARREIAAPASAKARPRRPWPAVCSLATTQSRPGSPSAAHASASVLVEPIVS